MDMSHHSVAVLAIPDVYPMEVGMPFQLLSSRNSPLEYSITLCSNDTQISTTGGFSLTCSGNLDTIATADTVIVPAFWPIQQEIDTEIIEALREAYFHGARMVSICLGAFALAATGLLDNRMATTHWRYTELLATMYPKIDVKPNVLFVDEGRFITSAGISSGIDVCLHLIECDYGHSIAEQIAKNTVTTQRRYGESLQYYPLISDNARSIDQSKRWALNSLDITISELAAYANMSERSYTRNFIKETGMTPMKWLSRARIAKACFLLKTTTMNVNYIAQKSGLGSAANMRKQFHAEMQMSPTIFRKSGIDISTIDIDETFLKSLL